MKTNLLSTCVGSVEFKWKCVIAYFPKRRIEITQDIYGKRTKLWGKEECCCLKSKEMKCTHREDTTGTIEQQKHWTKNLGTSDVWNTLSMEQLRQWSIGAWSSWNLDQHA